MEILLKEII